MYRPFPDTVCFVPFLTQQTDSKLKSCSDSFLPDDANLKSEEILQFKKMTRFS